MFGFFRVELILPPWLYLKLEIVVLEIPELNFTLKTYSHLYMNVSKHKSFYLQLNFSRNQFIQNHFFSAQNQT